MIGGVIWRLALLAIACVTAGVQLDRQSAKTHVFAEYVPTPLRSVAQRSIAAYGLDADNPEYALQEAERLVARRPLPAVHLRILAQAQFAAGEVDQSALTIQIAAQRGWREPLAQESVLRLALAAGDMAEASRRYAALFLRRDTEDALLEELGAQVLAEPGGEGRQTLVGIVAGGKRWHNQFLRRGARVMPADAFVEIVQAAIEAGTQFNCEPLTSINTTIASRNPDSAAQLNEIANASCPQSAG